MQWMRLVVLLAALAAMPLLAGCLAPPALEVAATSYPVAFLVGWIGQGHVEVATLVPPGTLLDDWSPSPAALDATSGRLLFYSGAGLEPWAARAAHHGQRAVDVTDGLLLQPLQTGQHDEHGDDSRPQEAHLHEDGHAHDGELDARVWLDPGLMVQMVGSVEAALAKADPRNADGFRARAEELRDALMALQQRYQQSLRQCGTRHFAVARADYGYLATFDVGQHLVPGLGAETLGPEALDAMAHLKEEFHLTHVAFGRPPAINVTLGLDGLGLRVAVLHSIESPTQQDLADGKSYFLLMNENLATLRLILRCVG